MLFETFFERKDKKKSALWLHGEASSGKSEFIRRLGEIFCSQKL